MSRPVRDHAWLRKRGNIWYIFWYAPDGRETKRRSLRTSDRAAAQMALAAFNAEYQGVPVRDEEHPWPAWAQKMCKRARENAKQKGRVYDICPADVLALAEAQQFRCAVTGMRFSMAMTYRNPFAPSLDQVRPGAGYTRDNIRIVTVIANTAMNGWGEAALKRLILESRLLATGTPTFEPNGRKICRAPALDMDESVDITET